MVKELILRASFMLASIAIAIGAWFKMLHYPNADIVLTAGVLAIVVFTVLALYEIHSSNNVNASEKIIWTIGFIFMNWIVGLIYLLVGRKSILYRR
jgi:hypothetical protein